MELLISQLHEGENAFKFDSQKDAWLGEVLSAVEKEGYKMLSPFKVDLSLTKFEPDYYLKGAMNFSVEQTCARCAEVFPMAVNHPFAIALAHATSGKIKPELSEDSEELDVNFFDGNEIDLNPILGEQFFLSIPYQSLCRTDCKGVCQTCGANLNTKKCDCTQVDALNPFSVLESWI